MGKEAVSLYRVCDFYIDDLARRLFVSHGLTDNVFMTFYRKKNGALKRFVSKAVPPRKLRQEAVTDLAKLAKEKGWPGYYEIVEAAR